MTPRGDVIAALKAEVEQHRTRAEAAEQELRDLQESRFVAIVGACNYRLNFVRFAHVLGPFLTEEEAHDAAERIKSRVDLQATEDDENTVEHDVVALTTHEEFEAAVAAGSKA